MQKQTAVLVDTDIGQIRCMPLRHHAFHQAPLVRSGWLIESILRQTLHAHLRSDCCDPNKGHVINLGLTKLKISHIHHPKKIEAWKIEQLAKNNQPATSSLPSWIHFLSWAQCGETCRASDVNWPVLKKKQINFITLLDILGYFMIFWYIFGLTAWHYHILVHTLATPVSPPSTLCHVARWAPRTCRRTTFSIANHSS